MEFKNLRDNGGARSGFERRRYTTYIHIPERRSGKERRSGEDRRKDPVPRGINAVERRDAFSQSPDLPAYSEISDAPQEN
jgi:hypothetical protein